MVILLFFILIYIITLIRLILEFWTFWTFRALSFLWTRFDWYFSWWVGFQFIMLLVISGWVILAFIFTIILAAIGVVVATSVIFIILLFITLFIVSVFFLRFSLDRYFNKCLWKTTFVDWIAEMERKNTFKLSTL